MVVLRNNEGLGTVHKHAKLSQIAQSQMMEAPNRKNASHGPISNAWDSQ
jgi:hypothetical protein